MLPPAPESDIAAWNSWDQQWKQSHPNGPDYAPPEYIALANAKIVPASGSAYRFQVQYNYDSASGALVSVSNAQTGFIYWQVATGGAAPVDAFGHLLAWTDGNNVSTVMAYDQATGAPVGISSGIGQSSAVQSLVYTWDGYGNLIERQDANQSNLYEKLTYDDLNRLSTSAVTNSAGNGPGSSFNYDAMGNITSRTIAGTSETYTYDPSHPYAVDSVTSEGSTIYTASYDADGNMTSRNGYPITWTVDNLPSSIASAEGSSTFDYGPDGNRYSQTATFNGATTATAYIGSLFEVVSTSTTTEYRHNIVAGGEVIAVHTIDANGNAGTSYLHYDHLGSVDAITDDSGSVIQTVSDVQGSTSVAGGRKPGATFDAFGLRRDAANWDYDLSQNTISTLKNYTDRGYTDQEQLDNLALVDMNGRVYDPTVGRMISADPTVPAPFYSQAFNRYSYVFNSPPESTDPSGLTSCPPDKRHCPTNADGSGDSGTNTETGSRIPGVNTGATCSGDCTGAGTGNWGPMGPGSGPGNRSGNGGGAPPDETGGGNPGTNSSGLSSSNSEASAGNDNHSSDGASTMLGSCYNCWYLGPVTVTGIAIGGQGGMYFASWDNAFTNSSISVYMPITPAEWNDVVAGNRSGFWSSRLSDKDPYAQIGCAFWCDPMIKDSLGPYWQTLANVGIDALDAGLLDAGQFPNSDALNQIGNSLMLGYASFINDNGGDLPTIEQFTEIHASVFSSYNIPMNFFGGTLFLGQTWEAQLTAPIWCPQCINYPGLFGGGGG